MDFEVDVQQCLTRLNEGKLILYPTDTVWGIGCDATNQHAINEIVELKQRPDKKSFVILVSDEEMLVNYAELPTEEMIDFAENSNKPVTYILQHINGIADNAVNENGSIAVRIPDDAFCQELLKIFGKPIISTSANISGAPTPSTFNEISNQVRHNVDYIVNYKQDNNSPAESSAIIMKNEEGGLVVIRK